MFCQDLELQAALTGRKKPVLGQKKAANNFFDADHHFETHKIGFKDFDQQWDVPKRGLEPVNWICMSKKIGLYLVGEKKSNKFSCFFFQV